MPPKETARTGREPNANAFERAARGVSDSLDRAGMGGVARDVVHGVYHGGAGVVRGAMGNTEGAKAEFNRAGQHFSNGGKKVMD